MQLTLARMFNADRSGTIGIEEFRYGALCMHYVMRSPIDI